MAIRAETSRARMAAAGSSLGFPSRRRTAWSGADAPSRQMCMLPLLAGDKHWSREHVGSLARRAAFSAYGSRFSPTARRREHPGAGVGFGRGQEPFHGETGGAGLLGGARGPVPFVGSRAVDCAPSPCVGEGVQRCRGLGERSAAVSDLVGRVGELRSSAGRPAASNARSGGTSPGDA